MRPPTSGAICTTSTSILASSVLGFASNNVQIQNTAARRTTTPAIAAPTGLRLRIPRTSVINAPPRRATGSKRKIAPDRATDRKLIGDIVCKTRCDHKGADERRHQHGNNGAQEPGWEISARYRNGGRSTTAGRTECFSQQQHCRDQPCQAVDKGYLMHWSPVRENVYVDDSSHRESPQ